MKSSKFKLTQLQTAIVDMCTKPEGAIQQEIVKALGVDSMSLCGMLKRLGCRVKLRTYAWNEHRGRGYSKDGLGLIRRSRKPKSDKRKGMWIWKITPKGLELLAAAKATHIDEKFLTGLANYSAIVGKKISEAAGLRYKDKIESWADVNCGKDLFIPGWGTFDINGALWALNPGEERRYSYRRRTVTTEFACSKKEIQCIGYFGELVHTEYRMCIMDSPLREWIGRWLRWFQAGNAARLDEVVYVLEHGEFRETMTPPQLFKKAAELRDQDYREQQRKNRESLKIPYPIEQSEVETEFGTLRPVKDYYELQKVGKLLKNCASSKHSRCSKGLYFVVVLWAKNGKPLAMGEHSQSNGWGQIVGSCNQRLDDDRRKVFTQSRIPRLVYRKEGELATE